MTAKASLLIAAALLMSTPASAQTIDPKVQARIDRILKATPLIDGHNDIAEQLAENYKRSIDGLASGTDRRPDHPLMTDMARLHQGRVGGQFWSVYIDGTITGDAAIRETIEQIDIVKRMIAAYPNDLEHAYTANDVLALMPANGGVVMANWVPNFLSDAMWQWGADQSAEEARLKAIHREDSNAVKAGLKAWSAAHPRPPVTVANVADHIEHIAKVAGYDHVGIGADLDGIDFTPDGLTGVQAYPLLFAELIRRGWSDANLAKLAGGNVLRVMRQAEAVATSMKNEPAAMSEVDTGK